jgi:hypothetical protein
MIKFLRSLFPRTHPKTDEKALVFIELTCDVEWWSKVEKMAEECESSPGRIIDAAVNLLDQELRKIDSTEDTK